MPFSSSRGRSQTLHLRTDLHVMRKLFHVSIGTLIAFLYLGGVGKWVGIALLLGALAIVLGVEWLRFRSEKFNHSVCRVLSPIMRDCEVRRMSGVPPYLASCLLAIAAFPKVIAVLSILFLACGDPIAAFFGVLYGKQGLRFKSGKSVIGTLAGVLTCLFLSLLFLVSPSVVRELGWSGAIALATWSGLVGGMVELIPLDADDNFTIPVISGFLVWAAAIAFGLPL